MVCCKFSHWKSVGFAGYDIFMGDPNIKGKSLPFVLFASNAFKVKSAVSVWRNVIKAKTG